MARAVAPSQSSKPAPLECSSMHAEEIEWRDTLAAEIVFCQRPVGDGAAKQIFQGMSCGGIGIPMLHIILS